MSHHRTARLAVASILILALTIPLPAQIRIISTVAGASRSIMLVGSTSGWNFTTNPNPTIVVTQGDSVAITYNSTDGALHRFVVDVDGNARTFFPFCPPSPTPDKCDTGNVPPSRTFPFGVDFAPGNYVYYCAYHAGQMFGNFAVQGFTLSSSPASLRVAQGSTNTSTITLASVNNFAGIVNLTNSTSPSGPDSSLNQTSANLAAGVMKRVTLTVSAPTGTVPGHYTVTVRGTSGSASNAVDVTVAVIGSDFTITASPSSLSITEGGSTSLTVTVTSVSSFSGSVGLTMVTFPSVPVVTPATSTIQLTPNGSGSLVLNVTIPAGVSLSTSPNFYSINITGTSGPLSHSVKVPITASSRAPSESISPLLLTAAVVAPAVFLVTFYLARRRRISKPAVATGTPP